MPVQKKIEYVLLFMETQQLNFDTSNIWVQRLVTFIVSTFRQWWD